MITIQTFETLVTALAQLFFLHRAYELSKSIVLVALSFVFVVAGFALGATAIVLTILIVSVEFR